jgi:penicillin amidase
VAERAGPRPETYVWGDRNRAGIRHPLSFALPVLAPLLDMPDEPLSGAVHMPRVMVTGFGPSERFAVSPGREEDGYFHMPGGQSGHPLSPWYRAGHSAWVEGTPTPFLPGPAEHRLELAPGS